jgi:hypothetical protein
MLLKRIVTALALALGLCACQQPISAVDLVTGGGGVAVLDAKFISGSDSGGSLAASAATYILAKIDFTNTTSQTLYPQAAKFYLIDRDGNRWAGLDSGSSLFAGVSNSLAPLAAGDKRTYVVGFRVLATTTGTIAYDY